MSRGIEKHSDTWRTVEEWATGRLEKYRRQLETDHRSAEEYASLRGKIAELKALLESANPPKEQKQ